MTDEEVNALHRAAREPGLLTFTMIAEHGIADGDTALAACKLAAYLEGWRIAQGIDGAVEVIVAGDLPPLDDEAELPPPSLAVRTVRLVADFGASLLEGDRHAWEAIIGFGVAAFCLAELWYRFG